MGAVAPLAQAADQPTVRYVGCEPGSLNTNLTANRVSPIADSGDDSVVEEQQPTIKGSTELQGVNEDDSEAIAAAIAAKGLTTILASAATDAAKSALVDAGQRKFNRPNLELGPVSLLSLASAWRCRIGGTARGSTVNN